MNEFIFTIFEVLLFLISVTGFLFGLILFSKYAHRIEKTSLGSFVYPFVVPLWLVLTFFLILSWIGYNKQVLFLKSFYFLTALLIPFYALCSAIAANYLENWIEAIIHDKKSSTNKILIKILRLLVLAYGGICIAVASSVIKASTVQMGISNYKEDDLLEEMIELKKKNSNSKLEVDLTSCDDFKNYLVLLETDSLKVSAGIISTFLGNYSLYANDSKLNQLKLTESGGGKNPRTTTLTYTNKNNKSCYLILSKTPSKSVAVKDLLTYISRRKVDLDYIKEYQVNQPSLISLYAFSSFTDLIGIHDYGITPIDNFTKRLDTFLKWFFYILTSVVIYEISKHFSKL